MQANLQDGSLLEGIRYSDGGENRAQALRLIAAGCEVRAESQVSKCSPFEDLMSKLPATLSQGGLILVQQPAIRVQSGLVRWRILPEELGE